jgi:hypothetical protein
LDVPAANSTNSESGNIFSRVLVYLYRGVIYRDASEEIWNALMESQARVMDHFSVIGLQLVIDESEGYAFLRYPPATEEFMGSDVEIPRLIARRSLTFHVSLLLALLRRRLAEFDAGGEGTRLVLTREEILSMVSIFMPDGANEARVMDRIEAHINKIKDMGFIRSLKNQPHVYEVLGIIKAFVDAEWLGEFDRRLENYSKHILSGLSGLGDEGE